MQQSSYLERQPYLEYCSPFPYFFKIHIDSSGLNGLKLKKPHNVHPPDHATRRRENASAALKWRVAGDDVR